MRPRPVSLHSERVAREVPRRRKANYVGAPAVFELDLACRQINEAYSGDGFGCYLVGSALKRSDHRDVDVVCILSDEGFARLFPDAGTDGWWEHDARWLLMTVSLSKWLSERCGLVVDFKFQAQSWANKMHRGPRHAIGMRRVAA